MELPLRVDCLICDRCGAQAQRGTHAFAEYLCLDVAAGYVSPSGDGNQVQADLCALCSKTVLAPWLRVCPSHPPKPGSLVGAQSVLSNEWGLGARALELLMTGGMMEATALAKTVGAIQVLLQRLFNDEQRYTWIGTPNRKLDGFSPIALIWQPGGLDALLRHLAQEAGVLARAETILSSFEEVPRHDINDERLNKHQADLSKECSMKYAVHQIDTPITHTLEFVRGATYEFDFGTGLPRRLRFEGFEESEQPIWRDMRDGAIVHLLPGFKSCSSVG